MCIKLVNETRKYAEFCVFTREKEIYATRLRCMSFEPLDILLDIFPS
jgi:hypothetical protein